jgi:chromosome segregation ATPase
MNPLDALLVPPALVKRALDDLHDVASLARRYGELVHGEIDRTRQAVEPLSGQLGHIERQLDELIEEMSPIRNLEPIRRGIEPLEHSMVSVRQSVDELEPMVAGLERKMQAIDPRLDEMQDSIEPIGDLAEKIPGNRRKRD